MSRFVEIEKLEQILSWSRRLFDTWRDGYDETIPRDVVIDMWGDLLSTGETDLWESRVDNDVIGMVSWLQGAAYMCEMATEDLVKLAGFEVPK